MDKAIPTSCSHISHRCSLSPTLNVRVRLLGAAVKAHLDCTVHAAQPSARGPSSRAARPSACPPAPIARGALELGVLLKAVEGGEVGDVV